MDTQPRPVQSDERTKEEGDTAPGSAVSRFPLGSKRLPLPSITDRNSGKRPLFQLTRLLMAIAKLRCYLLLILIAFAPLVSKFRLFVYSANACLTESVIHRQPCSISFIVHLSISIVESQKPGWNSAGSRPRYSEREIRTPTKPWPVVMAWDGRGSETRRR
jgi:hypothetical protein